LKTSEVFDDSEGKPVHLELGDPSKIDGLHIGIGSMVKGERALLTIKSHYAFRKCEGALKIPEGFEKKKESVKKRKVVYDVKLIDFVPRVDVNRDKQIIKTIIREGVGKKTPRQTDDIKGKISCFMGSEFICCTE